MSDSVETLVIRHVFPKQRAVHNCLSRGSSDLDVYLHLTPFPSLSLAEKCH